MSRKGSETEKYATVMRKVAVITGGSRGIGLATVKLFLAEGFNVASCAVNRQRIDEVLRQLQQFRENLLMEHYF